MTEKKKLFWGLLVLLAGIFLFSRLINLNGLPVFADEAIYIRWAQMMANDPEQYAFLPMFDGKTPMQMWLLSPLLVLNYNEPLIIGRFLSVLAGLGLMITIMGIVLTLGGKRRAIVITGLIYLLVPFTFFHDRLALTDTLFCLFFGLTFLCLLKLKSKRRWYWAVMAGTAYGLTLLTKLTGIIFLLPFLLILWFMPPELSKREQKNTALLFGLTAFLGLSMLYGLRISVFFPFLFQRGADFTFSLTDILAGQSVSWRINLIQFFKWQGWYMTIGTWLIIIATLIWGKFQKGVVRTVGSLILVALLLGGYFLVFGKIVYSRYYLPLTVFIIPAAALAADWLYEHKHRFVMIAGLGLVMIQGLLFAWPFWTNIADTKLEKRDREQYLTSWAAGFGNREIADYIKQYAAERPVAVATEGYFGTLPDGLSIYFDHSPLNDRVKIFGIGQPVTGLYESIKNQARIQDTFIVVNQDRLKFDYTSCCQLISKYERPYDGAPLVLLKVKNQ